MYIFLIPISDHSQNGFGDWLDLGNLFNHLNSIDVDKPKKNNNFTLDPSGEGSEFDVTLFS